MVIGRRPAIEVSVTGLAGIELRVVLPQASQSTVRIGDVMQDYVPKQPQLATMRANQGACQRGDSADPVPIPTARSALSAPGGQW